jgi:hypothetical protein
MFIAAVNFCETKCLKLERLKFILFFLLLQRAFYSTMLKNQQMHIYFIYYEFIH